MIYKWSPVINGKFQDLVIFTDQCFDSSLSVSFILSSKEGIGSKIQWKLLLISIICS